MDVSRRRAATKSGGIVAAGSVWETRMKSDEVKGGIKVFNGEESNNNNDNNNLDVINQNVDNKKVVLKRGQQTKRKTWKSESFEGPIQIAKGKSLDLQECKSPVSVKKSSNPIQNKKTRSELVKSKSEPINGGVEKSSSPSPLQLRKAKSQPQPQPQAAPQPQPEPEPIKNADEEEDKNEKFPAKRSEEVEEKEQEEVEVVEVCQDKAISGEVKNVTVSKSPPQTQTFPDVEMEECVEEDEDEEVVVAEEEIDEEFEEVIEAEEIEKKSVDIKEINVEELKKPQRVVVVNHQFNNKATPFPATTVYTNFTKPSPSSVAEEYRNFPQTHNKLQNLVDLIMWRDISKSAFIFGIGTFIIISSSYTTDLNISFISVVSYLGLVYLAVIFLYRAIICRGYIDIEEDDSSYVLGEEEAIWLLKLFLPYLNEFLLKLKALFFW